MKRVNAFTTMASLVLLGTMTAPVSMADDWNRKTTITFSGPVEIPGVHLSGWGVLPAGTYVFKILDSQSDRHIVQIFSKDEKTVYATVLAIPNYRLKVTDKTVMTFTERPAGEPEALRAWFYPGRNWGEEFVYPKARAVQIAKAANLPVLFTPAELPLEVAEPIKSVNEPMVEDLRKAPIMAIKPSGEEVQLAEVITMPPAEEATQAPSGSLAAQPQPANPAMTGLPATASQLPSIGMLGLALLGAAVGLKSLAKRLT
jgi:hypothetical protein